MTLNPLTELQTYGQSIWLDFIRRGMLSSGELQQMIEQDGLRGVTSNPAIFEKAISGTDDYQDAIQALAWEGNGPAQIYETLAIDDVRMAADQFRPVYERTAGRDGFVSLEVSPHLAYDASVTVFEAHRLWRSLARPNVLIKVPATVEGLEAIRQLISEGVNVNVTLLFGLSRYRQVVEAYIAGLEARARQGKPINRIASVASFFLSRIDVLVDPMLERVAANGGPYANTARVARGEVAIASAKAAYRIYREMFDSKRFQQLTEQGARPQRLLWASTGTKNPHYSDVKYVDALIGPETVNTLPLDILDAYRDHGRPAARLEQNVDQAHELLERLPAVGVDLQRVAQQLEQEGVEAFIKPFDKLMAKLQERCESPG